MFGFPMKVELDGLTVILRPPQKHEMADLAEMFSSLVVHMYTMGMHSYTTVDEEEWWEKTRKDSESALWSIVDSTSNKVIGVTGLHGIHPAWGCCTSGIIISNRDYWGKGIAYRAHLARTLYASEVLNRTSIQSSVRAPNEASLKALQKVGYRVTGRYYRNVYRKGQYLDTWLLSWLNPYKVSTLYSSQVPEELVESLQKAKDALELAKDVVTYM